VFQHQRNTVQSAVTLVQSAFYPSSRGAKRRGNPVPPFRPHCGVDCFAALAMTAIRLETIML
jgi:hypothetical protein